MDLKSDEQLIREYLDGEESLFAEILHRHLDAIYGFVCRYINNRQEAEDVVQEIFVKVWRKLNKFDGDKKFKPWLFKIAKNTIFDYLRKIKNKPTVYFDNDEENKIYDLPDLAPLPNERLEALENLEEIDKYLSLLPEIYSTVLILYYKEQLSLVEISQILNESVDTVKSRHRRALVRLRQFFASN